MTPSTLNRVAVIDDEAMVAELLKATLESGGVDAVDIFGSAADALACTDLPGYDAIFLDLSLPDMDGLPLVEAVVRAAPDTHLVIVSGHEREVVVSAKWHARLCGVRASDALGKPFTRAEVLGLLGLSPDGSPTLMAPLA